MGLGVHGDQALAYALAIGSGVVIGVSSGLIVQLHAHRTNLFALAVPAMAGPCVLAALLLHPTPSAYAVGLLAGSLADLAVLSLLERRHRVDAPALVNRGSETPNSPAHFRFLYASQVVALVTVYLERAIAGRLGDGTVGAMATGNRMAYGVVAIVAGSFAPELIRQAAQSRLASGQRWGRALARLSLATAILLLVAALIFERRPGTSPLTVALALYLLALPTMTALKAAQAVLQGSSLLRYDFAVVVVGAVTTVALASLSLVQASVAMLMCATPLAACVGALFAARQLVVGESLRGPRAA
jgi:hypothetical protein